MLLGVPRVVGRIIPAFALQHLKAAVAFRDHVIQIEDAHHGQAFGAFFEDLRAYGSACFMSSAAFLEALVNELFINPDGPLRTKYADFEAAFWGSGRIERKSILDKYQLALDLEGRPQLDRSSVVYRDAWALIELRNSLIHFKPAWDPERRRQVELREALEGKYAVSPFPDDGADFITMKSMSKGAVRWAVASAVELARSYAERAGVADRKKMVQIFTAAAAEPVARLRLPT